MKFGISNKGFLRLAQEDYQFSMIFTAMRDLANKALNSPEEGAVQTYRNSVEDIVRGSIQNYNLTLDYQEAFDYAYQTYDELTG